MNSIALQQEDVAASRVFQALADPTRRSILLLLSLTPRSNSELAQPLKISVTAVGQHLKLLQEAGLVNSRKQGRVRSSTLNTEGFKTAQQWLDHCRQRWEKSLDRLEDVLDEMAREEEKPQH